MKTKEFQGSCALTKMPGKYVKSHILPRALTKISRDGQKVIEAGIGLGRKTRPDTWYDDQLCTSTGEKILERIDTRGIEELRELNLVWSGWPINSKDLVSTEWDVAPLENTEAWHRVLKLPDEAAIRLFFLSILWRASASSRHEFDEVKLLPDEEEDLRIRVLNENPGNFRDFPIHLFQLSTRGISHNRIPLIEEAEIPSNSNVKIQRARIYIDGLIAHITLPRNEKLNDDFIKLSLGSGPESIVFITPFEKSRAFNNIQEMVYTVEKERRTPPGKKNSISLAIETIKSHSY